ncbi:MAG: Fic family protein [Actinomycetaceae bacterium]|nr:Fic family protein [Actinomycetaceae bacterium]
MSTPPFTPNPVIDALTKEISDLVGRLSADSSIAPTPRLRRQLQIQTVHSSVIIEGNTLPAHIVTAIFNGQRVIGPAKDIQEVRGAKNAYDIASHLNPYSQEDLLRAHGIMMENLTPDAGHYRTGNAGVFNGTELIHMGTPAKVLPQVMTSLFEWLSSDTSHPVLRSSIFHYEFEFIHPFSDGNGRMGRLWHTLLLSQWHPLFWWAPIESGILARQEEYYSALMEANRSGPSERFVAYMLEVIRDSLLSFQSQSKESP